MKQIKIFLIIVVVFGSTATFAQVNPFAKYGYDVKVLTMTNGRFNEFFDMDTVVQIGDLLYNTNSMKIIGFAEKDSITPMPDASVISRWVSPDPLAEKYWSITPYSYVVGNPIVYIDPDGRFVWKPEFNDAGEIILVRERGDNAETFQQQASNSGLNITLEEAESIVNNENGDVNETINLTAIANTDEGKQMFGEEYATNLNNIQSQFELAKDGGTGNCVEYALNNDGGVESFPGDTWVTESDNIIRDNYSETDVNNLISTETLVRYRVGSKDGKTTHISRFIWQGKGGKNYAINKDSYSKGLHIGNVQNSWGTGKSRQIQKYIKQYYNPKK